MRLIDADALLKEDFWERFIDFYDNTVFETIIEDAPTVDIKTEVAREIFAEIEEVCRNYYEKLSKPTNSSLEDMLFRGERFVVNEMWHDVAELKNKYIGGAE